MSAGRYQSVTRWDPNISKDVLPRITAANTSVSNNVIIRLIQLIARRSFAAFPLVQDTGGF